MVESVTSKIVAEMINKQMIDEAEEEQYKYVLVVKLEFVLTMGNILIISFILRQVIETLLFFLFFFSLRKHSGGAHAKKYWQCFLLTLVSYIGIIRGILFFRMKSYAVIVIFFLACAVIFHIGTINHPNIDMNADELCHSKLKARKTLVSEIFIIVGMFLAKVNELYILASVYAVVLCAVLLVLARLLKQEVMENEK